MVMRDLERRIDALESRLNQVVRVGTVSSVRPSRGMVRVALPDAGGIVSKALPVLFPRTLANKAYDLPEVGEQVLCVFLPFGLEQGFVIGAMYSEADAVPVTDRNKTHYKWPDGTWLEYDRSSHVLSGHVEGDVSLDVSGSAAIEAGDNIDLTAPQINLTGNISSIGTGGATATEEKTADTEQTGDYVLTGNFTINGPLTVNGDISCTGTNPNHHTH